MIRLELYDSESPVIVIERDAGASLGGWARLQQAFGRGVLGGTRDRIEVRADVVYSELRVLREVHGHDSRLEIGPRLKAQIAEIAGDRKARESIADAEVPSTEALEASLQRAGFVRELLPFQLNNLARIHTLPHAADFSVPGAGKTSVALANFALHRSAGRVKRALVVAPLAAFASWKEEVSECFLEPPSIGVHLGRMSPIPAASDILLTNYHRLASDYDRIRGWVGKHKTQVILDEAHRAKRGRAGVHGEAVLDLAFAGDRRDVLTGTPAPQGAGDLVALLDFLFPGQARQILPEGAFDSNRERDVDVLTGTNEAIRQYFVRTRKSELGLPPTSVQTITKEMGTIQRAIYDALRGTYRGELSLRTGGRRQLRALGRIVMYLLEAATNPALLTAGADEDDLPTLQHPPLDIKGEERIVELLERYGEYETPWKYKEIAGMVKAAAAAGNKVLVWSSFVRNLRSLSSLLGEYEPAVIHGSVPPRDGAAAGVVTREDELDRFRSDPACTVLLANPAACGEGISLHRSCHHAIYLDRTFNAGHFLQSQDRIHRIGLEASVRTQFTILVSADSIDVAVGDRLRDKVAALALMLDDPGLVTLALPEDDSSDRTGAISSDFSDSLTEADAAAVLAHLTE